MRKLWVIVLVLLGLVVSVGAQQGTPYVTTGGANARSCAQTSCRVVFRIPRGTEVLVTNTNVRGASVGGNRLWYEVSYQGQTVYIHNSLLRAGQGQAAPAQAQSQSSEATQAPATTGSDNSRRPANCAQAREWGLTAQQAGQWPHLDRDRDGVACYGD